MANTRRKKKIPKIKFEVSRSGILGIMIVIFCVFLWMFLLGLWAGRNVLPQTQEKTISVESVGHDKKSEVIPAVPRLKNGGKTKRIIAN